MPPYSHQALFVLLAIFDLATTRYVMARVGAEAEANPLWRLGFRTHPFLFDLVYVGAVAGMVTISLWFDAWFVCGLIAAFMVVAANNMIAVIAFRRRRRP